MKEILVYADWFELDGPQLMGILSTQMSRGSEIFSFEYDSDWLRSGHAQTLDPELKLYTGPQYLTDDKPNFGLFLDSSPDRWGRTLMSRREAIQAREEERKAHTLYASDFLLGVNDETRMGALRFKMENEGPFLNENDQMPTPPISSIRELEQASLRIEDEDFFDDQKVKQWLNLLMAPGSSLGGARPKASVIDPAGALWIAKFPSKNDDRDTGVWEYLVSQLAVQCGMRMAESRAEVFSQKQHTFLSKRFDRSQQQRIHFASAMTLLGYKDGNNHHDGGSYLELVELIEQYGADPTEDLREFWKRIVFSVAISNTDDHLRNHGFLLIPKQGWKLSPAYDMNPIPDGTGLSLNIDQHDNSLNFDLCLSVCEYFRWEVVEAKEALYKMLNVIKTWEVLAKDVGISRTEIEMMRRAFQT